MTTTATGSSLSPAQRLTLTLEGDLTIYEASLHKAMLQEALEQAGADGLELDLSQVSEIDAAGLQILLLAQKESQRLLRPLIITDANAAVRETISFCHLQDFFGDSFVQCNAE